ncbi:MAG: hypothetical protein AABX31_04760, partial [Nanoarchaeota archaeon]
MMKKEVMLAICAIFLVVLSNGCAPKQVSMENVPEPIAEDAQQEAAEEPEPVQEPQPMEEIEEDSIIKEKPVVEDDFGFDLPPDEDSAGWIQTSGPI